MRLDNKTIKRAIQAVEAKTNASSSLAYQALVQTNGDVEQAVLFIVRQRATELSERTGIHLEESEIAIQEANGDIEIAVLYLQATETIAFPMIEEPKRQHQLLYARVQLALSGHRSIATLMAPEEYHLFADNYNWDTGVQPLLHIANQPLCDQGTALLIYWRAKPTWLYQYTNRNFVPVEEQNEYDLIRSVEAKYLSGFYTQQNIRYDPRNDDGDDLTQSYPEVSLQQQIPTAMYQASPGDSLPEVLRTFRFQA